MSELPKFVTPSGEVIVPTDAADADGMRRAGMSEADSKQVTAQNIKNQYSSDWHNHPALAAFHTLEAGALGVAKSIPGLTTAATGYTQLADLIATEAFSARPEITKNFQDYMHAEGENHPYADAAGQVAGSATIGTLAGGTTAGYSPKMIAAVGAGQGLGGALDHAAMDHALTPAGAEKVGALTAQLAVSALLGAVVARGADSLAGGVLSNRVFSPGGAAAEAVQAVAESGAAKVVGAAGKVAAFFGVPGAQAAGKGVKMGVAGLGKALNGFDWLVSKSVAAGLTEEHVTGAATALFTHLEYETVSNALAVAEKSPASLVPTISTHLAQEELPQQVTDIATQQNARAIAYLAGERPKTAFATVAPVNAPVSLTDKAAFMDKVNAVQDPAWALANPTPSRLATLRAVYPVLMNNVGALVAAQAASMPDMPLRARSWAGQITGRPGTPMDDTRLQMLSGIMDAQQKAQRQAKQKQPSATATSGMIDSYQTQAQRLAK